MPEAVRASRLPRSAAIATRNRLTIRADQYGMAVGSSNVEFRDVTKVVLQDTACFLFWHHSFSDDAASDVRVAGRAGEACLLT